MMEKTKNPTQDPVRDSLIEQLKNRGADIDIYISRIDDYCWLNHKLQEMKKDVDEKGMTYRAISSSGKEYDKDNPSVIGVLKYSQEMTKILANLKLNVDNVIKDSDIDPDEQDL